MSQSRPSQSSKKIDKQTRNPIDTRKSQSQSPERRSARITDKTKGEHPAARMNQAGWRDPQRSTTDAPKTHPDNPLPRPRYVYAPAMVIDVGTEEDYERFTVPKEVMSRWADFFGGPRNDTPREVEFPQFSPAVFNTWLHFVYFQELDLAPLLQNDHETDDEGNNDCYRTLYDLYALASYTGAWTFANAITDYWVEYARDTVSGPEISLCNEAADTLPPGCCLRRLMAHDVGRYRPDQLIDSLGEMGPHFREDLLRYMLSVMQRGYGAAEPFDLGTCEFHRHDAVIAPRCV